MCRCSRRIVFTVFIKTHFSMEYQLIPIISNNNNYFICSSRLLAYVLLYNHRKTVSYTTLAHAYTFNVVQLLCAVCTLDIYFTSEKYDLKLCCRLHSLAVRFSLIRRVCSRSVFTTTQTIKNRHAHHTTLHSPTRPRFEKMMMSIVCCVRLENNNNNVFRFDFILLFVFAHEIGNSTIPVSLYIKMIFFQVGDDAH